MSLEPGSPFGPYRIVGPLGRGGMATVYRARDPALDRDVALKVLPAEFLHDPTFAERFRQEARVAAKLEHPHVVPIHGFGIDQGRPWMALRLVPGGSLADRLRRGPLAAPEAARILGEIASALDAAHARGIVHRDVKPANILLDESGRAYLADFGVARLLEGSAVATATGMVQGTPAYMAPEQAMGSRVDRRADVYALGIVAFECLTGRVPFTGTTPVAVLMKHVSEPVPEPAPGEMPGALTPVLRRCLAKDPAERWPTAGAFTEALARETARLPAVARADELATLDEPIEPATERRVPMAAPVVPEAHLPPAPPRGVGRAWIFGGLGLGVLAVAAAILFAARLLAPTAPLPPRPAAWAASPRPSTSSPTAAPGSSKPIAPAPASVSALATTPAPSATPSRRPVPTSRPRADVDAVAPEEPAPRATPTPTPVPAPTADPRDLAALYAGAARATRPTGRVRVYCEAKLEPALFRKTGDKDVSDSLADLREAIEKRGKLEIVDTRAGAEAVVQVLERGRQPATVGMRKVRVRVIVGEASVELVGQDSMTGFNTWSGAAGGAVKQVESWLQQRLRRGRDDEGSSPRR